MNGIHPPTNYHPAGSGSDATRSLHPSLVVRHHNVHLKYSHLPDVDMYSVITSATAKTGSATVSFGVTYSAAPKMFVGIFKMAASPGDIMDFTVTSGTPTTTGFPLSYSVGASTTISLLSVYTMSFVNGTSTSFLSVNHALSFFSCKLFLIQ